MYILNPSIYWKIAQEIYQVLSRHKELTLEMAKRELSDRYVGQVLGTSWAVGHPLALMAVYVVVFTFVFKMRIGGGHELPLDFTAYIISGYLPWMAFQDSMSKNCVAITGNAQLVKQVVFPIEILPVKNVLSSLLSQGVGIVFLVGYVLIKTASLPWTYILLPLLVFFQTLGMVGVGFLLSSTGTYFRDIKDIVQVLCLAGVYTMPIFYLPAWVPGPLKPILFLNPFSYMIWCYQDLLYFGRFEHPWAWAIFIIMACGTFFGGYQAFRKLKTYFGNVL